MISKMTKQWVSAAFLSVAIVTASHAAMQDDSSPGSGRIKRTYVPNLRQEGKSHRWLKRNLTVPRAETLEAATALPASMDLRSHFGDVDDQGSLGSCTAFASTAALEYMFKKQGTQTPEEFSRLFQYWNTRFYDQSTQQDVGGTIADAIKALCQYGVCSEEIWPYSDAKKLFKKKPSAEAYAAAKGFMNLDKGLSAINNQSANTIKSFLAKEYPVVFGMDVYDSFESDAVTTTGMVPMPNTKRERLLGGHALVLVGYDDAKTEGSNTGYFLVRNSWSDKWGLEGYCWIPYAYLTNTSLASDFWAITQVGSRTSQPPASNIASLVREAEGIEEQLGALFDTLIHQATDARSRLSVLTKSLRDLETAAANASRQ
ncbi:MAG: hypothetical protein A2977_02310 [Alphaproteobacteria bacterium RIFCSPLOWO2_01_FULL_45_8]|nr:MAG: hypothetical protein A3K20_03255 [Alphaproteobacteria bacterium GWA1_45_9]OFW89916.1 MAG: hypothetical protein A2621_03455 [Alphaproteobacteria bacterium RIFCSPHIGHO2_01_FULL_41_14]OFW96077.1 MAG: hypothetical protein A2977_02310 [Alphaproteobacteria bacterium RIFCSPLOWO2_01_FULL_45_8]HCI48353.1 hypothetical protein [Holosporales bacterium]